MSDSNSAPRRVHVERNIYRRPNGVFEVSFKDAAGKQRWRTVDGGITAARALRDQLVAQRGRGERIPDHARLRFGDAADQWLTGPVQDLREATRNCYRNAVDNHLRVRFDRRRLDAITPDDLAEMVRDLRGRGLAEATIVIIVGVANRIYRYAARRLSWSGNNPVLLMLPSERPKPSQAPRRRLFKGTELEETIAAASEPHRTLFKLAAITGARLSELLGLTWANVRLDPLEDAEVSFAHQVDRRGRVAPTKTRTRFGPCRSRQTWLESSSHIAIEPPISRPKHSCSQQEAGAHSVNGTSPAPSAQRRPPHEASPASRHSQSFTRNRANGSVCPPPTGSVPSMHSFRHTVASRALLAGESVDEIAFLLGHRDANVTRAVYLRELSDGRRRAMRRSRMLAEFGQILTADFDDPEASDHE